jgi:hypothetical protein
MKQFKWERGLEQLKKKIISLNKTETKNGSKSKTPHVSEEKANHG